MFNIIDSIDCLLREYFTNFNDVNIVGEGLCLYSMHMGFFLAERDLYRSTRSYSKDRPVWSPLVMS